MTKSEFYEKYGDVEVTFVGYYKYTFDYVSTLSDGNTLYCQYGGDADDIYRFDVDTLPITIKSLQPNFARISKDQVEVEYYKE